MTAIGTLLARQARRRPRDTAVVFEEARLDHASLHARVDRLARGLAAMGLAPGDKIVTVMRNGVELLELYWAAAISGLVIVPLSPMLRRQGLCALIEDCGAAAIFTDAACADAIDEVRGQLRALPEGRIVVAGGARPGHVEYRDVVERGGDRHRPRPAIAPDAPCSIIYSSGATSRPRGIVLTHRVRAMYGSVWAAAFRIARGSVVVHAGSIAFNSAFLTLMPALHVGATYVLMRRYRPDAFVEAVRREGGTHVMMVPSQLAALLDSPAFDAGALSSLEMICSIGAPLDGRVAQALQGALPGRLCEVYVVAEGFMTLRDRDEPPSRLGSVGRPPPPLEMRILRDDGSDAAPGEVGEIAGRGPLLMAGYHERPELTAQTIVDGWLRTGDLGHADEEGYLYLADRAKDMIKSGGVNVYPRDIEEVIARHPAVIEAAVFGVPDDAWGEAPVAAVRWHPGQIDRDGLRTWVNERVAAAYQRIRDVMPVDELPRGPTGQVEKRVLRGRYLAGERRGE
ncbi:MAG TPA: AMP-binding protein [Kofleriaceae bacterium]|nr:AMP-binding protein [Kofleriaceae bacterium]